MKKKTNRLLPRQLRFCQLYSTGSISATQAYIQAGYAKKDADSSSVTLLKNPSISKCIAELTKDQGVTEARILKEIATCAFLDIKELLKDDGSLKALKDMPEESRRAIGGIEISEEFEGSGRDRVQIGYLKKIKVNDKLRALELLGRNLKMFVDKVEHSADADLRASFLSLVGKVK